MATLETSHDALLLLRQSIANDYPCVPSTEEGAPSGEVELAAATYLHFPREQVSIQLTTPTRFVSSDNPVDLRSIYFAWLKRESAIPEYNAQALALNTALAEAGGAGGQVQNLAFVERLDLITWLEGASEESEYIKPLAADAAGASAAASSSAQVASGTAGGTAPATSGGLAGRQGKNLDPRLVEIYNGERRMGDRNSVLRGIKPTVRIGETL
jgi:parafibromin